MKRVGVYLETQGDVIKATNAEILTLVRQAGAEAVGILFAADARVAVDALAPYGLASIILVAGINSYHPETYAAQIAQIVQSESLDDVIGVESAQGKDLLPRVAALLDAPLVSDCTSIDLQSGTAVKPLYSGKVDARIRVSGTPCLYALRANAVSAVVADTRSSPEIKTVAATAGTTRSEIRALVQSVAKQIDLTEARIIVAGGRAMASAENFSLLHELADVLGAAVGASRAAVDAGYAPYDMQVGQTGKVVNPVLYIACGISGAVQHFAGMKSSKFIVAINQDPDAPIFKKSHYGIVGDLFEIVPLLTAEFKTALGT